jgi:hypothetical protein
MEKKGDEGRRRERKSERERKGEEEGEEGRGRERKGEEEWDLHMGNANKSL